MPKYGDDGNDEYKYQISLTTSNYIVSETSVTQHSKTITLIQSPEVMDSTTEITASKLLHNTTLRANKTTL